MAKKKLRNALRKAAEKLGWAVHDSGDGMVEFQKYSPAGEDFLFTVSAENAAEEAAEYAEYFDPEEHITDLVVAKRNGFAGVPSIKELVTDADAIDEMLSELADALREAEDG